MTSKLEYDPIIDRWLIVGNGHYLELHCGDVFELLVTGQWVRTTIEKGRNRWYSTAPETTLQEGLEARA